MLPIPLVTISVMMPNPEPRNPPTYPPTIVPTKMQSLFTRATMAKCHAKGEF